MKKSRPDPTTAENLEEKFERGEEVLDYFEMPKALRLQPGLNQTKGGGRTLLTDGIENQTARAREEPESGDAQSG